MLRTVSQRVLRATRRFSTSAATQATSKLPNAKNAASFALGTGIGAAGYRYYSAEPADSRKALGDIRFREDANGAGSMKIRNSRWFGDVDITDEEIKGRGPWGSINMKVDPDKLKEIAED